jgi:hypothetical protein
MYEGGSSYTSSNLAALRNPSVAEFMTAKTAIFGVAKAGQKLSITQSEPRDFGVAREHALRGKSETRRVQGLGKRADHQ